MHVRCNTDNYSKKKSMTTKYIVLKQYCKGIR